jgi:hypothetical protein
MSVKEHRDFFTTKYTSVSLSLKQGTLKLAWGSLNCRSSQVRLSKLNFWTKSKGDPSYPPSA